MSTSLPPIYRDIRRLLVHTEEMVRRFARYHQYTVGTDLRNQAMHMMRGVNQCMRKPDWLVVPRHATARSADLVQPQYACFVKYIFASLRQPTNP